MKKAQKIGLIGIGAVLTVLVGLTAYAALVLPLPEQQAASEAGVTTAQAVQEDAPETEAAPQIRVLFGELQWFDGARWHALESLQTLMDDDPLRPAEPEIAAAAPVLFFNRGTGTVARSGGGGGGSGGGGGGGSSGGGDEWSGDYE